MLQTSINLEESTQTSIKKTPSYHVQTTEVQKQQTHHVGKLGKHWHSRINDNTRNLQTIRAASISAMPPATQRTYRQYTP